MKACLIGTASVLTWLALSGSGLAQDAVTESSSKIVETPILAATATRDLKAQEGQKVMVFGRIEGSGKSPSGTNFVNFQGAEFYLTAFKSDLDPFQEGEPAEPYEGKRIVVTGMVSIYRDKPQIKLVSPDQVRILAEGEIFPPEPSPEPALVAEAPDPEKEVATAVAKSEPEPPKEQPAVDWRKYFK